VKQCGEWSPIMLSMHLSSSVRCVIKVLLKL